ncbi:MAG: HNH nuclease family protein [Candidatus Hydrogenedentes bacterium]|nr:HNH nuclease family protein [Candidatus Hydrogenedentota bacterium]
MRPKKRRLDPERKARFLAEVRKSQALREKTYREQALKLFPHVCAWCGREFSGKDLHELTVHHKDSNHMNNPPDGSNWELLCVHCHEEEHLGERKGGYFDSDAPDDRPAQSLGYQPFEGLGNLLKPDDDTPPDSESS